MLPSDLLWAAPAKKSDDNQGLRRLLQDYRTVVGMSIAFAFLFCSVLTDDDPITTAYLTTRGVPVSLLGTMKSLMSLTGLAGTYVLAKAAETMWNPQGRSCCPLGFCSCALACGS